MRMRRFLPPLVAILFGLGLPAGTVAGQNFKKLEFMAGCWEGTMPEGDLIEEMWTTPSENLMLGTTRYLKKGGKQATSHEFTFIERTDSTIYFVAQTHGEAPDTFRVSILADEVAAWTREGDDFPATIMYRRTSDGSNIARLEGAQSSGRTSFELRFRRVECPGK